jgi:hypothetical protein
VDVVREAGGAARTTLHGPAHLLRRRARGRRDRLRVG